MSTVAVSYNSLWDAAYEAKGVAKKLDKYADQLSSKVIKKLDKYNGEWSSNLSVAKSKANLKINELRNEQDKYETYAKELLDLRQECKDVDSKVRKRVSSLTAQFKESHGIKNNVVVNYISYVITSRVNKNSGGRWLNSTVDKVSKETDYLKDTIKEWYNYEGGKELIKGVVVGVLEIALAVCAIVGVILSGTWTLGAIAALIGGCIALANGVSNVVNEAMAYWATNGGDPATGRRRSDIDTLTAWIRKDCDSKLAHAIAFGIDVVNLVCIVTKLTTDGIKIIKNGSAWIKSMGGFKGMLSNIKTGFKDVWATIKSGNWTDILEFGKAFLKDIGGEIKGHFTFENFDGFKNVMGLTKDIFKDGVLMASLKNLLLSSIDIDIKDANGKIKETSITDLIDFGEDIYKKIFKSPVFTDDSIKVDLTKFDFDFSGIGEKLDVKTDVNISIPKVYMPNIPTRVVAQAA